MKIKIFMASANNGKERDILRDFGKGIESWIKNQITPQDIRLDTVRIGRWEQFSNIPEHTLEFEYAEYTPCDVAVMFGSWKPREKGTHQTRNSVALNANKFFVIETPLLNRRTDQFNTSWRVGLNGYLNRSAKWALLTPADAEHRLTDMKISWPGWQHNQDGHIILVLQLSGDASLRGQDINEWALDCVTQLRRITDKKIVIRSHPLCSDRGFNDHADLAMNILSSGLPNIQLSDGAVVPWKQELENAYCTVTYSSGMAIDSVLSGIPTIACDDGNFAYGFSSNTVEEVNSLRLATKEEIEQWLIFLAGCQWSAKEMRSGAAWQYLVKLLETE